MKKLLCLIPAIVTVLLCACGSSSAPPAVQDTAAVRETDTVQTSVEETKETASALGFYLDIQTLEKADANGLLCSVEYPMLKMQSSDAEKFRFLGSAIDNINNAFIRNGQSVFAQLSAAAEAGYAADSESFVPYARTVSVIMPRADSTAVSILVTSSLTTGGEAEDVTCSCLNCDSKTGHEIDIRRVVTDLPGMRKKLETLLPEKYEKVEFTDLNGSLNRFMNDPTAFVWTLGYQGITIYFNPFELSDRCAELLTVSLRFDSFPELFDPAFAEVPTRYSVPFFAGQCFNVDLDMNGVSDEISVSDRYDEKAGYSDLLTISVNGSRTETKTGLKDYECYLVHTGPGRDYLFINGQNLSEFGYINVFRISRTGASFVGGLYDTSLYAAALNGYCVGRPLLTSPDCFMLGVKCPLIRTLPGVRSYRIGSDGMPESTEDCYLLSSDEILTGKRELSTVSIDVNTGSGTQKAVKLPADTEYYFWRTDGDTFVDMKTSDGICCRLFVTKGSIQKVNGIVITELFDETG